MFRRILLMMAVAGVFVLAGVAMPNKAEGWRGYGYYVPPTPYGYATAYGYAYPGAPYYQGYGPPYYPGYGPPYYSGYGPPYYQGYGPPYVNGFVRPGYRVAYYPGDYWY
jgi:hypothetical protein